MTGIHVSFFGVGFAGVRLPAKDRRSCTKVLVSKASGGPQHLRGGLLLHLGNIGSASRGGNFGGAVRRSCMATRLLDEAGIA